MSDAGYRKRMCDSCSFAQSKGEPYGGVFCSEEWCVMYDNNHLRRSKATMSDEQEKPPEQEYTLEQLRAMATTPMLSAHLPDYYGAVKQLYAVLTERRADIAPAGEAALDYDTDGMVLYAFRYCLGRQTYAVGDCVGYLTRNWSRLSENTRRIIRKEIDQAFQQNRYGSEGDRAEWAEVLNLEKP